MMISVTGDGNGKVIAHHPDCPVVQQHRIEGRPIMTMLVDDRPLPVDLAQHSCLAESRG